MRVSLSSLKGHLDQGLQPLYLIFGAEVLLVEETLDHVRQVARNQGFNERLRLIVEPGRGLDLADHADWCEPRFIRAK